MSDGYDLDDKYNIDDLLDYNDNEESRDDLESQEGDSFNNDILKFDQKRSVNNQNNAAVNNRPISSYHRNTHSASDRDIHNINISDVNLNDLIERLSNHIKNKKICKLEFCENPTIYLDINDFADLFKKIKFEISKPEVYCLFQQNNPNYSEGYILIQTFLDSYDISWFEIYTENKEEVKEPENLYKINNEFKALQDEVMIIVKKEEVRAASSKKFTTNTVNNFRNLNSFRLFSTKSKLSTIQRPNTTAINNKKVVPAIELKPVKMAKFLKETTKKKQAEEEMLRVTLEKRNKENEKEFLKKLTEANQICLELNIQKAFSAFIEPYGSLMCKVHNKETNETIEIDYKKFQIEIRKLKKIKEQREEAKMWQVDNIVEINAKKEKDKAKANNNNPLRPNRRDRQEEIKKILIESLISKQKLKKQLKALRDKKIKNEKLINDNLKLTNLDD